MLARLSACAYAFALGLSSRAGCNAGAQGTVTVSGDGPLGTFTKEVDDCEQNDGVTLTHDGSTVIAVDDDPIEGNTIEIPVAGGGNPIQLFARDCRTLDVEIAYNGNTVNDDNLVNGSVTADCEIPDGGGRLMANATFWNCY
jgi:hypothetical protein